MCVCVCVLWQYIGCVFGSVQPLCQIFFPSGFLPLPPTSPTSPPSCDWVPGICWGAIQDLFSWTGRQWSRWDFQCPHHTCCEERPALQMCMTHSSSKGVCICVCVCVLHVWRVFVGVMLFVLITQSMLAQVMFPENLLLDKVMGLLSFSHF